MEEDRLRYLLVTDGTTDDALLSPLTWLLRESGVHRPIDSKWADLRQANPVPRSLAARIVAAVHYSRCDLLFIHRDAESQDPALRIKEIQQALYQAAQRCSLPPAINVIPVRMTEAWLLLNEDALRRAAGNPNGRIPLELPPLATLDRLADPKTKMYELLRTASESSGRKRKKFSETESARRVAELIEDFSPLRCLDAFHRLEEDIRQTVREHGWVHT